MDNCQQDKIIPKKEKHCDCDSSVPGAIISQACPALNSLILALMDKRQ